MRRRSSNEPIEPAPARGAAPASNNAATGNVPKVDKISRDRATKSEVRRLEGLGYKREHLTVSQDGHVGFDPEAVEQSAFDRALAEEDGKK